MTQPATSIASPRSILIVEDSPLFQDVLRAAVSSLALVDSVSICEDGAAALTLIRRPDARFDLALIDLGLPDISGIQVIEAIRARFPEVPIMVISVICSDETVIAAIRAGARGYIAKGQPETAITEAIKDVISGNYPISPSLARCLFRLARPPLEIPPNSFSLSRRETETLRLLARGLTYVQVAAEMKISLSTVQSNIRNLYRKLQVHSQTQAIAKAHEMGMISTNRQREDIQ